MAGATEVIPVAPRAAAVAAGLKAGTMLDAPQLDWLYYLARMAPDGPAVEVGVWKGGSIVCWSRARKDRGDLHAVDNFYAHLDERPGADKTRERFIRNTRGLNVTLWEVQAHVGAESFQDGEVAFCFIDADHGDGGIDRDLPAWVPKIMQGGIIVFHDYLTVPKPNYTVKREVDRWHTLTGWEKLGLVGSAIAFRRTLAVRSWLR